MPYSKNRLDVQITKDPISGANPSLSVHTITTCEKCNTTIHGIDYPQYMYSMFKDLDTLRNCRSAGLCSIMPPLSPKFNFIQEPKVGCYNFANGVVGKVV